MDELAKLQLIKYLHFLFREVDTLLELQSLILLSLENKIKVPSKENDRLLELANKYLKEAPLENPEEKAAETKP